MKSFLNIQIILLLVLLLVSNEQHQHTKTDHINKIFSKDISEHQVLLDSTTIVANTLISGLDVPWEIVWGPDNWIWFTEQKGMVSKVNPATGQKKVLLELPDVYHKKSYGLLGMAVHPDIESSPYVFLDYTYLKDSTILSKLVRYTYTPDTLTNPVVLLDSIPGNTYHNGSRIIITPDRKIIMSTGDAGKTKLTQDTKVLSGKILRMNLDGTVPEDNPIKGSLVWSWGHRNPQGLVYASNGKLYSSEHGPATDDEVNIIKKGRNYGWPDVRGFCDLPAESTYCDDYNIVEPLRAWTPTIATAGIDYYDHAAIPEWRNAILLTTLKACGFRVLKFNKEGDSIISETIYFDKVFGRLRDICISPSGDIFISTSNRDWHLKCEGFPKANDDRIIRIKASDGSLPYLALSEGKQVGNEQVAQISLMEVNTTMPGEKIYNQYCIACHQADGNGVSGMFPPITGTPWVLGKKNELISLVLNGMSGEIEVKGESYDQEMPPHSFLTDKQIADVLTFIRQGFGNKASAVTPEEVAKVRAAKKGD